MVGSARPAPGRVADQTSRRTTGKDAVKSGRAQLQSPAAPPPLPRAFAYSREGEGFTNCRAITYRTVIQRHVFGVFVAFAAGCRRVAAVRYDGSR
jgi:hypothetical protein